MILATTIAATGASIIASIIAAAGATSVVWTGVKGTGAIGSMRNASEENAKRNALGEYVRRFAREGSARRSVPGERESRNGAGAKKRAIGIGDGIDRDNARLRARRRTDGNDDRSRHDANRDGRDWPAVETAATTMP